MPGVARQAPLPTQATPTWPPVRLRAQQRPTILGGRSNQTPDPDDPPRVERHAEVAP
ncbi:hypothetical protein [Streptomyces sp. NL15-2K]|uniref:hypothetical protein n=1 Tax=Streptomyces sp. NL15-2K TaxID=376149 RepID=UPI000FF9EF56|nr:MULTISPECIES: hypothetical protein [Actinomycetes]WKX08285.1 hypothetical protein Q4V64_12655 [Kutzneria buriramensis]GCB50244.1 hypothetical protein SNL152K_7587 [Streptomyces sp. NL15-2K]